MHGEYLRATWLYFYLSTPQRPPRLFIVLAAGIYIRCYIQAVRVCPVKTLRKLYAEYGTGGRRKLTGKFTVRPEAMEPSRKISRAVAKDRVGVAIGPQKVHDLRHLQAAWTLD